MRFLAPKNSGAVKLQIGKDTLQFQSLEAFAFALEGRVSVPMERFSQFAGLSVSALRQESVLTKKMETRIVRLFNNSSPKAELGAIEDFFSLIPIASFSKDYGWRSIMAALQKADAGSTPTIKDFRHTALVKYMQYLATRQQILKEFRALKKRGKQLPQGLDLLAREGPVAQEPAEQERAENRGFERLPKGEPISLEIEEGQEVNMILSKHKCRIVMDRQPKFVGLSAEPILLEPGRTAIGRDTTNDIVADNSCRDISRLHLVVEYRPRKNIQLTDLSSHGTYLPTFFLEKAHH